MTFLPIVDRELRVASRQARTYWSRLMGAAMTMVIMTSMWMSITRMPSRLLGYEIFQAAVFMNFVYCLTGGVQLTADCISREKREGTLGFLFLTDLKGYDVVLGKLAVTSLRAFYGLFAVLPVLMVPVLMGGVAFTDVLRAGLVLVNTMLFSLSSGILVSVFCHEARKATGLAWALVMAITLGIPGIGAILAGLFGLSMFDDLLVFFAPSPGFPLLLAIGRTSVTSGRFFGSCGIIFCWTLLFFVLASRLVAHKWQDRPPTARFASWRDTWRDRLQGGAKVRALYRTRLLELNPMLWLTSRDRLRRYYFWIFLGALLVFWVWGFLATKNDWLDVPIAAAFILISHAVLKLGLSMQATERFGNDLRSGALELVLSTRTGVEELVRGQLLSLRRHFDSPVAVVLVADGLLLVTSLWTNPREMDWTDLGYFTLSVIGAMVLLKLDLMALSWVGMWNSMTSKDHQRAYGQTNFRILALPWLGVALVNSLVSFVQWKFSLQFGMPFLVQWGMWLGFSLAADIYYARWARGNLYRRFRLMVMDRYLPEPAHPLWARMGTLVGRVLLKVTRAGRA